MNNWQRFLVIIQLCLAFSIILWYLIQPFMGEYFALRSRMLIYEFAMGNSDFLKNQQQKAEKISRNGQRFEQLNVADQEAIKGGYRKIQSYAQRPASIKILDGMKVLLLRIPPFQLAWIVFATAIGVMLLLITPGARQAAWILPLIALIYGIDNQLTGHHQSTDPDAFLFPSETVIIQEYLNGQDAKVVDQELLQQGWNNYLVANWISNGDMQSDEQLENAEFNFTVARLKLLNNEAPNHWIDSFHEKKSYLLLTIYLIWNLLFAISMREKGGITRRLDI